MSERNRVKNDRDLFIKYTFHRLSLFNETLDVVYLYFFLIRDLFIMTSVIFMTKLSKPDENC